MKKQILFWSVIWGFITFACEMKVESGKFTCISGEDTCAIGMKCAKVGIDPEFRCYDESLPECGDGIANMGEQCDGNDLSNIEEVVNKCGITGLAGSCTANCEVICNYCGNGIVDATGNEDCDGLNIGDASCVGEGYYPGTLKCNTDCTFDATECGGYCGDNIVQDGALEGEECEINNLNETTCNDIQGFYGDSTLLSCNTNCTFNTDLCEYCGDGIKNGTEECDELDYGEKICVFGTHNCLNSCIIDDNCYNIIQWGGDSDDYGQNVAADSNNNIYIIGYTWGDLDENNLGGYDISLRKYSSNGSLIWAKQWGTSGHEQGNGVAIDSNDNIYVTGYTDGNMVGTNLGGKDIFLSKYSSDGTQLWTKQYGTVSTDQGYSVVVDSNNNIYVTGYTWGDLAGTNSGFADTFLSKFSFDGTLLWTKQWGTLQEEYGQGLAIDSNNNIYVAGQTYGDLIGISDGGWDIFLYKYTSDGTVLWAKQWGTTNEDIGFDVATDSNDSVYVSGRTDGTMVGTNWGGRDIFLTKYTTDGSWLWNKQWGTIVADSGNSVAIDSNNNIYIAGSTSGHLGGFSGGDDDIFLSKYTSDGSWLWNKQWGFSGDDIAYSVVTGLNNNIYITGKTAGDLGGTSSGGYDIFLIGTHPNP
jgi:uncharacterized delta-60 repeat protein